MKDKQIYLIIGCVIGIVLSIVGAMMKYNLTPIGEVNGKKIYSYQVKPYIATLQSHAVVNYAKDKVFFDAMSDLGIIVDDKIVEEEYRKQKNIKSKEMSLDKIFIKKAILQQKALSHFIEKTSPIVADEEHELNKQEVKAELGANAYDLYIEQAEQEADIKVY